MFAINFNFPYRKKDGSLITMEKALDGVGADLDLIDLDDVTITDPAEGDGLIYDNTAHKWKNIPIISRILTLFNAWKNNGAYNLCNPNIATSQVINGVTFTVNDDGSVTANGTATDRINFSYTNKTALLQDILPFKGKTLKVCGCPSGGGGESYWVAFQGLAQDGIGVIDTGDGATVRISDFSSFTTVQIYIAIIKDTVLNNVIFKPMITTDLNATYDDYVPHAMTNMELTPEVSTATITQADVVVGTNKLSKQGNVVNLHLTLTGLTCDAYANIGSIPTEYRPKSDVMIQAIQYNASDAPIIIGVLSASGYIQVRKSLTSANIATISASWTTN